MSSAAVDIAGLINTAGIATSGTNLFVGREPGETSFSVVVIDAGGSAPNPLFARDFVDIQIIVSGNPNDYATAYTKAKAIKDLLLGKAGTTIGTSIYFAFNMRSDTTFIGYDTNNRPKFTLNFRIIIDSAATGNRLSL